MTGIQSKNRIVCTDCKTIARPGGHYAHLCEAGGLVFISGQLPITPEGIRLTDKPFAEQTRQVLFNIDGCLSQAGIDRSRLLQVRIYVTDMENWPLFNELYAEWIGGHRPARAVAGIKELHYGLALEIEAVALASSALH